MSFKVLGIEVGMKLHAKYAGDGQFYPAVVLAVPSAKAKNKKQVKISYVGFAEEVWVPIDFLKSKKLGLNQDKVDDKSKTSTESKSNPPEPKAKPQAASSSQAASPQAASSSQAAAKKSPSKGLKSDKESAALTQASDAAPTSEGVAKTEITPTCGRSCLLWFFPSRQ